MSEESPRAFGERLVGRWLRSKYRVDKVLGVGGMAVVFAGAHRNGNRVAIKLLLPEYAGHKEVVQRFLKEGYAANAVQHDGVVRVLDDDIAESGEAFVVMELLEGASVEELQDRHGGRLSVGVALALGYQLLDVLAAAHAKAIVHRDIKPANLFLTRKGELKVLDFGIARFRDGSTRKTTTSMAMGTPDYAAPEQMFGRQDLVDARADVFATGATLFHLLSGEVPRGDVGIVRSLVDALPGASAIRSPPSILVPATPPCRLPWHSSRGGQSWSPSGGAGPHGWGRFRQPHADHLGVDPVGTGQDRASTAARPRRHRQQLRGRAGVGSRGHRASARLRRRRAVVRQFGTQDPALMSKGEDMREEFCHRGAKEVFLLRKADGQLVRASLIAGKVLTGKSRQFEDCRAVLTSEEVSAQVNVSALTGELGLAHSLEANLDPKGYRLLVAATHPGFSVSGLSAPDGGYLGSRPFGALDPAFPGSFPAVAQRNEDLVRGLHAEGKLRLATLPVARDAERGARLSADRVAGMLLGVAIGDSLGNTSESKTWSHRRERFGEITDYRPNCHEDGQPVGLPSDDTQLTVWMLDSMLEKGHLEVEALATAFSTRRIFGIGGTMRRFLGALKSLAAGTGAWEARQHSAGNGAIMRVAGALAPHLWTMSPARVWDVVLSSALTHDDATSTAACVAFAEILCDLLTQKSPPPAEFYWERFVEVARPLEGHPHLVSRNPKLAWRGPLWQFVQEHLPAAHAAGRPVEDVDGEWFSGAFVLETVPIALYLLARYAGDPEKAILQAVNIPWDNDTVAAMVGAAVGGLHGARALPPRWKAGLLGRTTDRDDGHLFETIQRLQAFGGSAIRD